MPEDESSIWFLFFNEIGILAQLSRTQFEAQLPAGVLVSHFSVLNNLVRVQDGRTPLELARAFQVPKTTMTHTLAGLEKAGYVEMRPNEDDARSKRVWITAKGRVFRDEAIRRMEPTFADLGQVFDGERIAAILPELQALREIMDRRRDSPSV